MLLEILIFFTLLTVIKALYKNNYCLSYTDNAKQLVDETEKYTR